MRTGILIVVAALASQDAGREALRQALKDTPLGPEWIYNDVEAGFAEARRTGKPMLVVFR
jgi:hypothetical protein